MLDIFIFFLNNENLWSQKILELQYFSTSSSGKWKNNSTRNQSGGKIIP